MQNKICKGEHRYYVQWKSKHISVKRLEITVTGRAIHLNNSKMLKVNRPATEMWLRLKDKMYKRLKQQIKRENDIYKAYGKKLRKIESKNDQNHNNFLDHKVMG